MQPIYSNFYQLYNREKIDEIIENGTVEIVPVAFMRGRTFLDSFIIVDEAQNLSPHEIKTIVTRVGEGTKVVLTGDTDQIDSPYLDAINNGLTYIVDRLKREDIVAHIELKKGERSKLAAIATKLL